MGLLRSRLGAITILMFVGLALFLGAATVDVNGFTQPERRVGSDLRDLVELFPEVEAVQFTAVDGVSLDAWVIPGRPGRPAVILCHDLGNDRSALTHLAADLRKDGLTLLLLDFRGHGTSGGQRSTLGLDEKRDILAAVDFLSKREPGANRIGIYGVGMGAHAAALAARDRRELSVLVLDGVYPDVGYALARDLFPDWSFARQHLAFVPATIFAILHGTSPYKQRASAALDGLQGRDVLLLAPKSDEDLSQSMSQMYTNIPEQPDVDGNIVFLSATYAEGLYGQELDAYYERVGEFFRTRLQLP